MFSYTTIVKVRFLSAPKYEWEDGIGIGIDQDLTKLTIILDKFGQIVPDYLDYLAIPASGCMTLNMREFES